MTSRNSYSKYQKDVIRFLTNYLGTDVPFSYERSSNNHLKVLIEGVNTPLYTASTPSDCKSLDNFIAEVKRQIKASKANISPTPSLSNTHPAATPNVNLQRLMEHSVKTLRRRLPQLKEQEQELIMHEKSLHVMESFRQQQISQTIGTILQQRHQSAYVTAKQKKEMESTISKHLNFLLPDTSYYAELLKPNNQPTAPHAQPQIKAQATMPSATTTVAASQALEEKVVTKEPADALSDFFALSCGQRLRQLRALSKQQAELLLKETQQALAQNHEADLKAVITLIKEKGLSIEEISARL